MKKQWRPDKWDAIEISKGVFGEDTNAICDDYKALIEAGADAMHRADVEWIKKHILITEGVFSKEDWLNFIGEEVKE